MSFWDLSDGSSATSAGNSYGKEVSVTFGPIPAFSYVRASIEKAYWRLAERDNTRGPRYINIQWRVSEPEQYSRRVIFQELWVEDLMPWIVDNKGTEEAKKRRDQDLTALSVIDSNAKGKLSQKSDGNFTDDHLMIALEGASMVVRVGVKKKPRSDGTFDNFINAIRPKTHEVKIEKAREKKAQSKTDSYDDWGSASSSTSSAASSIDSDEIPF